MDAERLVELSTIQEFFQIDPAKELPKGTRLLLESMVEVKIPAGTDIVTYGADCDDGMYIILDGYCDVYSVDGQKINVQLHKGDFIGEMGLINDQPRSATVQATTDVTCANISKELFDELGQTNRAIYGSFLTMLYNRTTKLVAEQQRIRSELEIATRIQDGVLEHDFSEFNKIDHVQIKACARPAKEMGGDFYDVFMIDDTHLCFLIADVSGKGVPAAMFMSMAKIHIRNYATLGLPLAEVAMRTNDQLCYKNKEGMFVTVFLCVLDLETNDVTYINAGHDLPYLSVGEEPFHRIESKVNLVFGMMDGVPYREQHMTLAPGDSFYLYTDGVNEAINVAEEQFGNERVEAALNSHFAIRDDVDGFVQAMYDDLDTYAGAAEQADDITMVYITRVTCADDKENGAE